jgi:predicted GTPase
VFKDRQFILVDTAGWTKIAVDSRKLNSAEEMARVRAMEAVGKYPEKLPGMEFMDPEVDPSQFSSHISQMALISALNALRFSQVVVMMVESEQGNFAGIDLQLARK